MKPTPSRVQIVTADDDRAERRDQEPRSTSCAKRFRRSSAATTSAWKTATLPATARTVVARKSPFATLRPCVLIDGQRVVFPIRFPAPAAISLLDSNVIPVSAIERIEVLTDGASGHLWLRCSRRRDQPHHPGRRITKAPKLVVSTASVSAGCHRRECTATGAPTPRLAPARPRPDYHRVRCEWKQVRPTL